MTKVLSIIMSAGMLVALAGCAATDKGGAQKQASEQSAAATVSSEGTAAKAGCSKDKPCCAKAQGTCSQEKPACNKPCDKK